MPSASAAAARPSIGVPEVEAVRQPERLPAGARDVPRGLEDGKRAGRSRIEPGDRPGPVERDGDAAERGAKPEDGAVEPRAAHRPRADEVVVLLVDRPPVGEVRSAQQREERLLPRERDPDRDQLAPRPRPLLDEVPRRLLRQERRWNRADRLALEGAAQLAGVGDLAYLRVLELPPPQHGLDGVAHLRPNDRHHPLLALGDHDLPGREVGLAERHPVERDVDAGAVARHLGERGGEPGGAAVLQRLDQAALDELDGCLDQLLARERVADLHGGALVRVGVAELLAREHARAPDPVSPGGRAEEQDQLSRAARACARETLAREDPHAHRVDEAVVAIARVEDALAADRRHPDRVPVRADPGHGPVERMPRLAEPKGVEERDRPSAHRDDVAQDPADARRGALERLDRCRVVVALDLERDGLALAEVDHAGVLARALEDALALRRQPAKERRRVLVPAVLRPEEREDGQLEVVRLALEQALDPRELPVGESEGAVERLRRDRARQVFESSRVAGRQIFPSSAYAGSCLRARSSSTWRASTSADAAASRACSFDAASSKSASKRRG